MFLAWAHTTHVGSCERTIWLCPSLAQIQSRPIDQRPGTIHKNCWLIIVSRWDTLHMIGPLIGLKKFSINHTLLTQRLVQRLFQVWIQFMCRFFCFMILILLGDSWSYNQSRGWWNKNERKKGKRGIIFRFIHCPWKGTQRCCENKFRSKKRGERSEVIQGNRK